jgi:UDP:flavonoid glycosyltransferase YjiC (YdhE family)
VCCLQVVNKGVGESIPAEQISVEAVKAGVTKVLCDPSYRERASHISDSVRRSPGVKQAVETITAFAMNAAAGSG